MWNAGTIAGPSVRGNPWENSSRKALDVATPRLIDSCITTASRLLPPLALRSSRSPSVSVFIAVNCMLLTMPNKPRWMASQTCPTSWGISAKLAINTPSSSVLTISTWR